MVTITLKMTSGDIHQLEVDDSEQSRILVGLWTDKFALISNKGATIKKFINPENIECIKVVES